MTAHLTAPAVIVAHRTPTDRPVGWYRDPQDARLHRYWDGIHWSEQVPSALPMPREPETLTAPAA